jgi:hypothetical protein
MTSNNGGSCTCKIDLEETHDHGRFQKICAHELMEAMGEVDECDKNHLPQLQPTD